MATRNARFAQGGNAFFEGKVKGNPTPRIVWTRKAMEMKESGKHQMIYEEATGRVALQGRPNHTTPQVQSGFLHYTHFVL